MRSGGRELCEYRYHYRNYVECASRQHKRSQLGPDARLWVGTADGWARGGGFVKVDCLQQLKAFGYLMVCGDAQGEHDGISTRLQGYVCLFLQEKAIDRPFGTFHSIIVTLQWQTINWPMKRLSNIRVYPEKHKLAEHVTRDAGPIMFQAMDRPSLRSLDPNS